MVISPIFYAYRGGYEEFKDGYATVMLQENEKWGLIDKTGKAILPFKYIIFVIGLDMLGQTVDTV